MPQQFLNRAQIGAVAQQVRRVRMAKAVRMQRRISTSWAGHGGEVNGLRIGLNAGEATTVEGDYFGWRKFDPEDLAARQAVEPLAHSLNAYLPRFLKSRKTAA